MIDMDENALVAALKRGDEAAFEQVVRQFGPRLLAVARRFLGNEADAQDAVQDAFLSAFRGIEGFQEGARLSTWLHRITVNACLMKLRTRRRRPEMAIEDLLPKFQSDGHREGSAIDWAGIEDTSVLDRETQRFVRAKIEELPESYRSVLLLRDIEEKSTAETAELLDMTETAVKTRLHRARLALRNLIDPLVGGVKPS
jgi:RNA polymerase sigma-70 factor (ECF subfamily)